MKETVLIITGGSVEENTLRNIMHMYPEGYIIGVDHGLDAMDAYGIVPDLAVGDFDSANTKTKTKYTNSNKAILLNKKKDFTDTHAAVMYALEHGARRIVLLGATGTRLDHVQGNFALLKLCRLQEVDAIIYDSNNRIQIINSALTIKKCEQYGRYVSLLPYSDIVTGVTLTGFVYELRDATMIKEDTIGISNEIREEECHIVIGDGYLMVMETKD